MNDYRLNRTSPKILTETELKSIERRQKAAILYQAKDKIEDYQNEVFGIIENEGLNNEDPDKKLKTALQVLEYIIPKKKSTETTIITRKLEDIITESIQEAEIIEDEDETNTPE